MCLEKGKGRRDLHLQSKSIKVGSWEVRGDHSPAQSEFGTQWSGEGVHRGRGRKLQQEN